MQTMFSETTKRGCDLSPDEQKYVLAAFVHRFTGQHKPAWARLLRPDGTAYPVQFKDDADWLAHTDFEVTARGKLDTRNAYCCSSPTWPNNPELRAK
jgi:hypothetical protein